MALLPPDSDLPPDRLAGLGENELTAPSLEVVGSQLLAALEALQTLTRLALADRGARDEAQVQLERVAGNLKALGTHTLVGLTDAPALETAWKQILANLSTWRNSALAVTENPAEEETDSDQETPSLSDDEIARRLSTTIPGHLRPAPDQPGGQDQSRLRRVVVASLEPNEEVGLMLRHAADSFSREAWVVTNLGPNMPIMALTGTVMEIRPSVLALVIGQGGLMAETVRLISDLKRQLIGLRVIALGPLLAHSNLNERLRADLYSDNPGKAAHLADQFFHPLNRLGDRLSLSFDLQATSTPAGDSTGVAEGEKKTES